MDLIRRTIFAILLAVFSNLIYDILKLNNMDFLNNINVAQAIMLFIIVDLTVIFVNIILRAFNLQKLTRLIQWTDDEKKLLKLENKLLKEQLKGSKKTTLE